MSQIIKSFGTYALTFWSTLLLLIAFMPTELTQYMAHLGMFSLVFTMMPMNNYPQVKWYAKLLITTISAVIGIVLQGYFAQKYSALLNMNVVSVPLVLGAILGYLLIGLFAWFVVRSTVDRHFKLYA